MEQAASYKYSEGDVNSTKQFSKAAVLMCVRVREHDNDQAGADDGDVPGKKGMMNHDDKSVGEKNAIVNERNVGKKMGVCQDGGRDSQTFEEEHECNCGHKGPIANHLRTNQKCVQGIRDALSIREEMSDESLIVHATLVLQGCPVISCAGGNHDQIPDMCMSWWKESGWKLMQWQDQGENLTSTVIKQKCQEFVRDLKQKQIDDGQQEMSNENAADSIQRQGNMAELDDVFLPPVTSTQIGTKEGNMKDSYGQGAAGVEHGGEAAPDLVK